MGFRVHLYTIGYLHPIRRMALPHSDWPTILKSTYWATDRYRSQFENHFFTKMCSGSEAGSCLRLIDFVYHSALGLRVIKKRRMQGDRYKFVNFWGGDSTCASCEDRVLDGPASLLIKPTLGALFP